MVAELTSELQRSHEENKVVKRRVETMRDENDIIAQRLVEKQQEVSLPIYCLSLFPIILNLFLYHSFCKRFLFVVLKQVQTEKSI